MIRFAVAIALIALVVLQTVHAKPALSSSQEDAKDVLVRARRSDPTFWSYIVLCNSLDYGIVLMDKGHNFMDIRSEEGPLLTLVILKPGECTKKYRFDAWQRVDESLELDIFKEANGDLVGVWNFRLGIGDPYKIELYTLDGGFAKTEGTQYVKVALPTIGGKCGLTLAQTDYEHGKSFEDTHDLPYRVEGLPVCKDGKWQETEAITNTQFYQLNLVDAGGCYGKGCW
eukprot:Nk52_evm11s1636 gene=Nk52_evmTU11s1636